MSRFPIVRNKFNSSQILKSVLWSLLIFTIGFSLVISIREGEFNLMGLIISVYYFVPATLLAFTYAALIASMEGRLRSDTLAMQIVLALISGLLFATLWIVFDGMARDYRGMDFSAYWVRELMRYLLPIVYFGIAIPVLLKIITGKFKG